MAPTCACGSASVQPVNGNISKRGGKKCEVESVQVPLQRQKKRKEIKEKFIR